jgi:hypothetical protein
MLFFPIVNGKRGGPYAKNEVHLVHCNLDKFDSYVKVCE